MIIQFRGKTNISITYFYNMISDHIFVNNVNTEDVKASVKAYILRSSISDHSSTICYLKGNFSNYKNSNNDVIDDSLFSYHVNYNNLKKLTSSIDWKLELCNLEPNKALEHFTVKIEEFIKLNSTSYQNQKKIIIS